MQQSGFRFVKILFRKKIGYRGVSMDMKREYYEDIELIGSGLSFLVRGISDFTLHPSPLHTILLHLSPEYHNSQRDTRSGT